MTESISGYEAIRRPVLVEYSEVLTMIDQLVSLSRNETDKGQLASRARQIVQLLRQLKTMEITSLSSTVDLKELARALTIRSGALTQIVSTPGSTLQQIADAFSDWVDGSDGETGAEALIRKALDPKEWKADLPANDKGVDPLFYEYHRAAHLLSEQHTSELKGRLEALQNYKEALTTLAQAQANIDPEAQKVPSALLTRSLQAIGQLKALHQEGALEHEGSTQQRIEVLFKLYTAQKQERKEDQVRSLLQNSLFTGLLEEGIEGASAGIEQAEEGITKVLLQYEDFTRAAKRLTQEHAEKIESRP